VSFERIVSIPKVLAAALASVLGCSCAAYGADLPAHMPVKAVAVAEPTWSYRFTPYAWLPSIKGDSTIRGRTTALDASFIDIAKDSEIPKELFGLMGSFEARNGRFSLMGDAAYLMIGRAGSGARQRSVDALIGGTLSASVDVKFKMAIVEMAAAYELARFGAGAGSSTSIDVYGGGRLWWQKAEASLAISATLTIFDLSRSGGRAVAASGDITWVDPIIGLRLRHEFAPGKELVLRGDIGGFGVGSQFSWQAVGGYSWVFATTKSTTWSGMVGYRALYADYSQGSGRTLYEFDILQHGPIMGVTMRF
jgi:hypothetical protein